MSSWFKKGLSLSIGLVTALVTVGSALAGCSSGSPATTGPAALTIVKGTQSVSLTMAQIKKMTPTTGSAGEMSSTGKISGPFQYKGVTIMDLVNLVGGINENNAVRVGAKDGYSMTLSYKQITQGNFTVINSTTGKEVSPSAKPTVFVAYEKDGVALDDTIGPLRLGMITEGGTVTEGHWWVKWTQKIEVIATETPWSLTLAGAMTEEIDSATFESCSAVGCHGKSWTDDQGRVWQGVPLWNLVGKVDDKVPASAADSFNDGLAAAGYSVIVKASDNFSQTFTVDQIKRNDNMIVAFRRDGAPVPENQWPLRLVGPNLTKQQMVGKISDIQISFAAPPPTTSPPTTTAAPGPTVLTITSGSQTKTFSLSQIKAMTALSGYAGQKNKAGTITGPVAYKGVALTDVLAGVGGLPSGASVKVTAKDGFSKTLTYDQVTKGSTITVYDKTGAEATPEMKPTVFLAYEKDGAALDDATGPLRLGIMTCQNQVTDGSWWVNGTVTVEVVTAP